MIDYEVAKTELLLLGAELGLVMSQSMPLDEVKSFIIAASSRQPPPQTAFSVQVATKYNIIFGKELLDCFGLWEKGNDFCAKCPDQPKCSEVALKSGLNGMAVPAIGHFRANDDHEGMRTSRKLEVVRAPKTESRQVEAEHNSVISWVDENFRWLVKRVYKESVTYKLPSQNQAILKVEGFSQRNYYVHFSQVSGPMAVEMALMSTKYGWYSYAPDLNILKAKVKTYLDSVKLQTASGAPVEFGGLREDLIAHVESCGCTVEFRSQYQTVLDPLKCRVLYLEKFTPKSLTTCVPRFKADDPQVLAHKLQASQWGFYYRGNDAEVLRGLVHYYVGTVLKLGKKA
jgi:hypothetical protein